MNTSEENIIKKITDVVKIKTIFDEEIELPKLTLRKELEIYRKYKEIIEIVKPTQNKKTIEIIEEAFNNDAGFEIVMDILKILIGKEKDFILDNFELTEVISSLLPFYLNIVNQMTKKLKAMKIVS